MSGLADRTALEFRALAPDLVQPLGDFFESLAASDGASFHPHPLTRESARQLCEYQGRDLYFVAICDSRVLGYGLLRGWDEGYIDYQLTRLNMLKGFMPPFCGNAEERRALAHYLATLNGSETKPTLEVRR